MCAVKQCMNNLWGKVSANNDNNGSKFYICMMYVNIYTYIYTYMYICMDIHTLHKLNLIPNKTSESFLP